MDVHSEILIKAVLTLLGLAAVVLRHRRPGRLPPEKAGAFLWIVALAAAAAWPNFGGLHGWTGIHNWEQFHYFLGSKYFPELGYDGIYAASLAAEGELGTGREIQSHVRDLRDNEVVPTITTRTHQREVKSRFTQPRWTSFVADVRYFLRSNDYNYITRIRSDHGYNPTPTWTFTARLFSARLPAGDSSLALLGWIDPLLLALMFWAIFRTFGSRTGCLCLVVFGLGYPWRFDWVGGAFLRQDWLAAVGVALCLMKRKSFLFAGALIAYATMVRVFPAAFLLGPAAVAARALVSTRRPPAWALRLVAGFGLGVIVCLGVGCLTPSGATVWTSFAENLEKHRGTWLTNNVGLENLFLYDRDTLTRADVDFSLSEPWLHWQAKMDRLQAQRRPFIVVGAAAFVLLLLIAVSSWEPHEAAAVGAGIAFGAVLLTCYYWAMLCLLPLARSRWGPTAGWLGLNVGLFVLHLATPSFEMIYGLMSLGLAIFLLVWLGPDALATVRGVVAWRRRSRRP